MGRPKKDRPEDPLAASRAHEGKPHFLPPLQSTRNAPSPAALKLASSVRRLRRLEQEIGALNAAKSDVYKELRADGFTVEHVRRAMRELRIDPIVRAERDRIFASYWEQLHAALDAAEGGE